VIAKRRTSAVIENGYRWLGTSSIGATTSYAPASSRITIAFIPTTFVMARPFTHDGRWVLVNGTARRR
jgi:hypothetical protein